MMSNFQVGYYQFLIFICCLYLFSLILFFLIDLNPILDAIKAKIDDFLASGHKYDRDKKSQNLGRLANS